MNNSNPDNQPDFSNFEEMFKSFNGENDADTSKDEKKNTANSSNKDYFQHYNELLGGKDDSDPFSFFSPGELFPLFNRILSDPKNLDPNLLAYELATSGLKIKNKQTVDPNEVEAFNLLVENNLKNLVSFPIVPRKVLLVNELNFAQYTIPQIKKIMKSLDSKSNSFITPEILNIINPLFPGIEEIIKNQSDKIQPMAFALEVGKITKYLADNLLSGSITGFDLFKDPEKPSEKLIGINISNLIGFAKDYNLEINDVILFFLTRENIYYSLADNFDWIYKKQEHLFDTLLQGDSKRINIHQQDIADFMKNIDLSQIDFEEIESTPDDEVFKNLDKEINLHEKNSWRYYMFMSLRESYINLITQKLLSTQIKNLDAIFQAYSKFRSERKHFSGPMTINRFAFEISGPGMIETNKFWDLADSTLSEQLRDSIWQTYSSLPSAADLSDPTEYFKYLTQNNQ